MPLTLASVSHNVDIVVNGAIEFFMLRQSELGVTQPFGHMMLLALVLASCDADDVISDIIAFLSLR